MRFDLHFYGLQNLDDRGLVLFRALSGVLLQQLSFSVLPAVAAVAAAAQVDVIEVVVNSGHKGAQTLIKTLVPTALLTSLLVEPFEGA